jgi:hypothetical protein
MFFGNFDQLDLGYGAFFFIIHAINNTSICL